MTDLLRYLEMEDLYWIDPRKRDYHSGEQIYPEIPGFRI